MTLPRSAFDQVSGTVSEKAFMDTILQAADLYGWWTYHTHDSRRSTAGFPDLVLVKPPRVAGAPVHFECKLTQLVRLENRQGDALDQWLVIGEAVGIHIDPAMLEDGVYQTARPVPITRGGGPADYCAITQDALFRMKRPD